jgi:hypothetical protein
MTEQEWLTLKDPAAVFEVLYRRKRPSRGSLGQFFTQVGIDWNKSAFEVFAEKKVTADADSLAILIRCFFGNPFRPVSFDAEWRTSTAVLLAKQMYESRDFSTMPILADALQDAGCDNADILNHCRDANGTHVRGCWVIDLVLGKS